MSQRTRILLTGATGNWGREALRALREVPDRVQVLAAALDTAEDRAVLEEFSDMESLEVAWGDLTDAEFVARCVARVDRVIHLAAVVSPLADARPGLARRVNIQSMRHIIEAVRALPDPDAVGVVGVGTVAQTGHRNPPVHWGRVGDPIRVSRLDEYGQTKVVAERMLVDSGLSRWASLRQTGMFNAGTMQIRDPIMTHVVLDGVMEWVTAQDSARLVTGIADPDLSPEFWGRIYNVGGGPDWRLTNWQLQQAIVRALGGTDVRRWFDRNWFATGNFHGHWYSDSAELEQVVAFRRDTVEEAFAREVAKLPRMMRAAGFLPAWMVKQFVMKPLAHRLRGTMHAIRHANHEEVNAHFGSFEAWERIGGWDTFTTPRPSRTPTMLDHGYDESVDPGQWSQTEYRQAAGFRGGALLSPDPPVGQPHDMLAWECAEGHRFDASPLLVLRGGHWCPVCTTASADEQRQAERNPFLAQVAFA